MNLTKSNQSDGCEHFSCPERSASPAVYILLYVCSAAVVLLTVCGNLLVIISVVHFKQLHTPTNTLVLSLAVSDFFIGALVMPLGFPWTIESCWIFGRGFCTGFVFLCSLLSASSNYNVALIAVDRFLALSNPFLYMNRVSVRITCTVIGFKWCTVSAYSLACLYFNGNFENYPLCPGECSVVLNEIWIQIDLVFTFVFPLSLILILYTLVFLIAKKHASAIRELSNHTRPETHKIPSHSMKSQRKAAKVLSILVSVFLICLLPYFIYSLLCNFIKLSIKTLWKLAIVFCLNSTINPVIYALFYPWFRKCVKLIIILEIFRTRSSVINVFS